MPCRDEGAERDAHKETRRRLDDVTEMLCAVLDALETAEEPVRIDHLHITTQQWWSKHKAQDVQRIAEERRLEQQRETRARAYAKLTPEERRALGFK